MRLEDYRQTVLSDPEAKAIHLDLQPFLSLGNHILELRLRYGLSQVDFARRVGLKLTHLSRLESGLGNPTLGQIQTIARKFNLQVVDLIKEDI